MHITWCDFGLKVPSLSLFQFQTGGFFFLAAMCMIFFIWFEKERDSFLQDHWGFFIYLFQRTLLHYATSQRSSLSLKHLYCNLSYLLGSIILLVLEIVLQVNVSAGESFYSYNSNSLEN